MGNNVLNVRLVGGIQIIGGTLEVLLGTGGILVPEPATTVGGVILVAHGTDTIIAGFRSLFSGTVQHSFTQQGTQSAAEALGARPEIARRIGIGADIVTGLGPSITGSITRRLAIAGAQQSQTRVAVAYLNRGFTTDGHNAVGITINNSTAWFELAGLPMANFMQRGIPPGSKYIITSLAITGTQAGRALSVSREMARGGEVLWSRAGPNCTTEALRVMRAAGVIIPEWARSPFLLHTGVRYGSDITVVGGTASTSAPALAPR